jgi:hypothetical protein
VAGGLFGDAASVQRPAKPVVLVTNGSKSYKAGDLSAKAKWDEKQGAVVVSGRFGGKKVWDLVIRPDQWSMNQAEQSEILAQLLNEQTKPEWDRFTPEIDAVRKAAAEVMKGRVRIRRTPGMERLRPDTIVGATEATDEGQAVPEAQKPRKPMPRAPRDEERAAQEGLLAGTRAVGDAQTQVQATATSEVRDMLRTEANAGADAAVRLESEQQALSWAGERDLRNGEGRAVMAVQSLTSGRYEDVIRDVQRGRLSIEDVREIGDKLLELGLISKTNRDFQVSRIEFGTQGAAEPGSAEAPAAVVPEAPRAARPVKEMVADAQALGAAAFAAGRKRIPAQDPDLARVIAELGGDTKAANQVLSAWTKAWDTANLAAPVPEVAPDQSTLGNADPTPADIEKARALGAAAFGDGLARIPGNDSDLWTAFRDVKVTEEVEAAWREGYDGANPAAAAPGAWTVGDRVVLPGGKHATIEAVIDDAVRVRLDSGRTWMGLDSHLTRETGSAPEVVRDIQWRDEYRAPEEVLATISSMHRRKKDTARGALTRQRMKTRAERPHSRSSGGERWPASCRRHTTTGRLSIPMRRPSWRPGRRPRPRWRATWAGSRARRQSNATTQSGSSSRRSRPARSWINSRRPGSGGRGARAHGGRLGRQNVTRWCG